MTRTLSIFAFLLFISACSKKSSEADEYIVTTIAGSGETGSQDGQGVAASFTAPVSIAIDAQGNIYVADDGSVKVRKIAPDGMVSTLAGAGSRGFADGQGSAAKFNRLSGITTDAAGNVYVTDETRIRKITSTGMVSTIAGTDESLSVDGPAATARFVKAHEIVSDNNGNLIVTDYGGTLAISNKLRKISTNGTVNTISPSIQSTYGMSVDAAGNIYLPRPWNEQVIKIEPNGNEQVVINNLRTSVLHLLYDQQGGFYCGQSGIMSDYHTIYKLDNKGVLQSIAGSGQVGYRDGDGKEAQFHHPGRMALDAQHHLYVIDEDNRRIRKISKK